MFKSPILLRFSHFIIDCRGRQITLLSLFCFSLFCPGMPCFARVSGIFEMCDFADILAKQGKMEQVVMGCLHRLLKSSRVIFDYGRNLSAYFTIDFNHIFLNLRLFSVEKGCTCPYDTSKVICSSHYIHSLFMC